MEARVRTLDKLQSLEQLYRRGFRSELIDRAIDKLLAIDDANEAHRVPLQAHTSLDSLFAIHNSEER